MKKLSPIDQAVVTSHPRIVENILYAIQYTVYAVISD